MKYKIGQIIKGQEMRGNLRSRYRARLRAADVGEAVDKCGGVKLLSVQGSIMINKDLSMINPTFFFEVFDDIPDRRLLAVRLPLSTLDIDNQPDQV